MVLLKVCETKTQTVAKFMGTPPGEFGQVVVCFAASVEKNSAVRLNHFPRMAKIY